MRFIVILLAAFMAWPANAVNDLNQSGGFEDIKMSGTNPLVSVGEDIWGAGGTRTFFSTAQVSFLSSASANDTSAGTGCQTVFVEGVDSDYAYQSETASTNGTTAVQLTNSYLRINRARCVAVGSGGVNAGNLQVGSSSIVQVYIPAGDGESQGLIYTVPKSKYAVLSSLSIGFQSSSGENAVKVQLRKNGESWRTISILSGTQESGMIYKDMVNATLLPPKSDIRVTASQVSGSALTVNGHMEIHQKR